MLERFERLLENVQLRAPRCGYLSNLTGNWAGAEVQEPGYWVRQARSTVQFAAAVDKLAGSDRVVVEIGPGNSLGVLLHPLVVFPSLPARGEPEQEERVVLSALGQLWREGVEIDWKQLQGERGRVLLPGYAFQRQRYWIEAEPHVPSGRPQREPLERWLWMPSWRRTAVADGRLPERDTCWLVFEELGNRLGVRLSERLREQGQRVVRVRAGTRWERQADGFVIRPGEREDYGRLLECMCSESVTPDCVVHLWSVAAQPDWDSSQQHGFYSLLWLAQAIGPEREVRLWAVTRQAEMVESRDRVRPEQATLAGLLRVLPQEYSRWRCRRVDLDCELESDESSAIEPVWAELTHERDEPVVAWRGRQRWSESLEPLPWPTHATPPIRQKGVYLITGGCGGIGLELAHMLARQYRARLVLLGRTLLPPRETWSHSLAESDIDPELRRILSKLQAIEQDGGEVLPLQADVSDPTALRAALERTFSHFGALHGVIHAAGPRTQFCFREMRDIDFPYVQEILRPKVQGTFVLLEALEGIQLDFLLTMSSLSARLGGLGFAAYAAANAAMDAILRDIVHNTRRDCVTVNWDAWQLDETQGPRSNAMRTDEAFIVLHQLLTQPKPAETLVATSDPRVRLDHGMKISKETDSSNRRPRKCDHRTAWPQSEDRETNALSTDLESAIADMFCDFLGIQNIGLHDNFFELGGHSLLATRLVLRIRQELGADLSLRSIFDRPTVEGVATTIAESLAAEVNTAMLNT
jgi:acyl transferase domain-containing protein